MKLICPKNPINKKIQNFLSRHRKGPRFWILVSPVLEMRVPDSSPILIACSFSWHHSKNTTSMRKKTTRINWTHRHSTIYIQIHVKIYCTTIHNLYRWTLLLCTQLYTGVQLGTTLWCTHYAWISCTVVYVYCSPVSEHMYCKLVLTNESPSKKTIMNRVDQSQLRF